MQKELKEIQVVGNAYYHRFLMEDESIQEVETTQEDYEQLAGMNPNNPSIDGGTWVSSYATNKYDTIDGKLAIGDVAFDGTNYITKTASTDLIKAYPMSLSKTSLIQTVQEVEQELLAESLLQ